MTPRPAHVRSGITLTEILISILIMGIGLISLATLFPLGLIRLREASRQSRSGLLAESALADLGTKNLLAKESFSQSYYGPYLDPFTQDINASGQVTLNAYATSVPSSSFPLTVPAINPNTGLPTTDSRWIPYSGPGTTAGGLPVCYDPLWRAVTGYSPQSFNPLMTTGLLTGYINSPNPEIRFGAGPFLRTDPSGSGRSAYGLQRISNFTPYVPGLTQNWPFSFPVPGTAYPAGITDVAAATFVSPEDVVMQNNEVGQSILNNPTSTGAAGGVVPEFFQVGSSTATEIRLDWRYSWLFTGQQVDATNGKVFEGDIVVMDNRPFGLETVTINGSTGTVPSGEQVMEAVFGYSNTVSSDPGYGVAADRLVLLRWPSSMPDPEIKTGSWIADVTYERFQAANDNKITTALSGVGATGTVYPMQRCHWYQVAKKGEIQFEDNTMVPYQTGYRRMVLYTTTPLRSRTLLSSTGDPVFVNAALFMPSVINVFSKVIYSR